MHSTATPPLSSTITPKPIALFTPTLNLTAAIYPNSKMCETSDYQGYFLTSFNREFGESPNKQWLFIHCLYDHEKHSHYILMNQKENEKSWVIDIPEITENPWTWRAWTWAKDSQTLYLGYSSFCEYWSTCMYVDATALFILDSNTHEFIPILPIRDDKRQYAFDFSRDIRYLAYIINGTQSLFVRTLITGAEFEIRLDTSQNSYGDMHWSPDDTYLVFRSSSKENISDFSLWLLKKDDYTIVQLLKNEKRDFFIAGWKDNSKIILHLFGVGSNEPFQYMYDIFTGELNLLNQPTPTQTP